MDVSTPMLQLGTGSEVTCLQHAERMSCAQALLGILLFLQSFQMCFLFLLGISFICICHSWQTPECRCPVIPLLIIIFFSENQGNTETAHVGVQLAVKMHSGQQLPTKSRNYVFFIHQTALAKTKQNWLKTSSSELNRRKGSTWTRSQDTAEKKKNKTKNLSKGEEND